MEENPPEKKGRGDAKKDKVVLVESLFCMSLRETGAMSLYFEFWGDEEPK